MGMNPGYGRGGRGAALMQALVNPVRVPGQVAIGDQGLQEGQPAQATPIQGHIPGQQPMAQAMPPAIGRGAALQQILQQRLLQPEAAPVIGGRGFAADQLSQSGPQIGIGGRGVILLQSSAPAHEAVFKPIGQGVPGLPPHVSIGRGIAAGFSASASPQLASPASSLVTPSSVGPTPTTPQAQQPQPGSAETRKSSSPEDSNNNKKRGESAASVGESVCSAGSGEGRSTGKSDAKGRLSRLEYMMAGMDVNKEPVQRRGAAGTHISLCANSIRIKCKNEGVYQYAVSYSPSVDSRGLRCKLLYQHVDVIGAVRAFDGAALFLPKRLDKETILKSRLAKEDREVTISVQLVKVLRPEACVQLYNIIFRNVMTILKLVQVGRHHYDPLRPASVPQHRLEVWPGYITAIQQFEGGLMLLTDVSHRVLRTETVLEVMRDAIAAKSGNFKDTIAQQLLGCTVLTRYNNKTYRVDDIAWDKSPRSTFKMSNGQEMSFVEYYKTNYNKEIKDPDQPLLLHRPKKKDLINRRQRGSETEVICLVPELCYTTGLTDDMRADFTVMKDLACHTRVTPAQRQLALRKYIETVNSCPEARLELDKWGLELESDLIRLDGRVLPEEVIQFGGNLTCKSGPKVDWTRGLTSNPVITAVDLKSWIVIYTNRNSRNANDFAQCVYNVSRPMGISVAQAHMIEIPNDRTETYIQKIRDNLGPQSQMVVAIFPTARDDRYNAFKKLCCVECPVASQVINLKTLTKPAKFQSVVQKVLLQMNCKLGGELWGIEIPAKNIMVVGMDVYHDGKGTGARSIGAVVASLNERLTRYYSRVSFQGSGMELIDCLKVPFLEALKKYHEVRHCLPERIVVYRDGVGDGQLKVVSDYEVGQLTDCFRHFGEGYMPKLTVVVVQKRINARLFQITNRELQNPPPGTVMDHTITRRDWYDFFLVSQHVGQGTVSPTHYVVVHDTSGYKEDIMQRLTYKMTHLYYNWPGTIRVPAPCQNAHKLAYLVGQNIRREPSDLLSDRLYYL